MADEAEIQSLVDQRVKEALKINNAELLTNIGHMIDKISDKNLSNNGVNSFSSKGIQMPKFKRTSNEEQYTHSSNVLSKLDEAVCSIATGKPDCAKERIIEGINNK